MITRKAPSRDVTFFLLHRPWLAVVVASVGLIIFSGCRILDRQSGATGGFCTTDTDCQDGLSCLSDADGFPNGYCSRTNCTSNNQCAGTFGRCVYLDRVENVTACVEGCVSNADCRSDGYVCSDLDGMRGCMPESQSTGEPGEIGASCARDTDCDGGLTCLTSFVFGYCTQTCSSDVDCAGGQDRCVDIGGGSMRCMASCSTNTQCRFGYQCTDKGSGGVCDLDEGGTAVRNPGGVADGETCTEDIECQGGTCITGSDFPGGYCTTRDCDALGSDPATACASGTDSSCVATQTGAFCFVNCTTSDDCRDGYRCTSLEDGGDVCYSLSPIVAPDVENTGPIDVTCSSESAGGTLRRARFTVSTSAIGFSITPFSPSGSEVEPISMTLPDGTVIDFESDYAFQTINSLLLATIVPMSFPGAPIYQDLVQPGEYEFLYDSDDAQSCYFVVEQTALGTSIDVNFYLVGVPGITSAEAPTDDRFADMMDEFRTIYSGAGISVDTVRYFDVTGSDLDDYRIIRDFSDVYRLIAISESPGDTRDEALSINVFLIDDFNVPDIPGLLGLSAGIPGVPGVHGNGGAGLVFSSVNLFGDPRALGQTLSHEIGHFLGLRHTSERGGREFDPINDTPTCSSPEDSFGCPDVGNLMFPFAVDDVTQRQITAEQKYVLERFPLVK